MLPRWMFHALGIVCAAPLLLNAQKPIAPLPTLRPGAGAAALFGQDDDITVLTLSFAPVGAIHA